MGSRPQQTVNFTCVLGPKGEMRPNVKPSWGKSHGSTPNPSATRGEKGARKLVPSQNLGDGNRPKGWEISPSLTRNGAVTFEKKRTVRKKSVRRERSRRERPPVFPILGNRRGRPTGWGITRGNVGGPPLVPGIGFAGSGPKAAKRPRKETHRNGPKSRGIQRNESPKKNTGVMTPVGIHPHHAILDEGTSSDLKGGLLKTSHPTTVDKAGHISKKKKTIRKDRDVFQKGAVGGVD